MICENCGKTHDGKYASGRFCSKHCAKSFSSKKCKNKFIEKICEICGNVFLKNIHDSSNCICDRCKINNYKLRFKIKNNKISPTKINNKCVLINNPSCDECIFKNICTNKSAMSLKLKTLMKYFPDKINLNNIFDYEQISQIYVGIKSYIQSLIDNGLSSNEICIKLFGSHKKGNTIFKILGCKTRKLNESIQNMVLLGKFHLPKSTKNCKFKYQWHTTWDDKQVFLRSSYEKEYAEYLDKKKIKYEVEKLRIKYYDSQKNKYRIAIPDFYIESENMIVEIKSSYTQDIQNMKDKFNEYRKLGYNCKCICDKKEILL